MRLNELEQLIAEKEAALKPFTDELNKLKPKAIDAMAACNMQSVSMNGRIYYLATKNYPAYVGATEEEKNRSRDLLTEWLKHGTVPGPDGSAVSTSFLVKESYNQTSLMAFINECPVGDDLLPQLPAEMARFIRVAPTTSLMSRKGK